jgi:ABC-type uncharacterized transport system substrate-binding protein
LSVERGALFSLATDYRVVGQLSADIAARILLGFPAYVAYR